MTSVLCVGIAVYDQIFALKEFPSKPTKTFASDFAAAPGGPAANGAITVVRQGGQAALWARVGADMQGERIVSELAAAGVDVSRVRRVAGCRSGTTAVGVTPDGERMILAFADPTLDTDASWLPLAEVARHDAVLADVRWPAASRAVLGRARDLGIRSVLDADLTPDKTALRSLVPLATHVIFSEPALAEVTDMDDPRPALEAVFAAGDHEVVGVTLGARGCAWRDRDGHHEEPGLLVRAVDTLAAGDVFHGAYALAQARRLEPRAAARFANVVAGLKCTRWGGGSTIPSAAEVDHAMAQDAARLNTVGGSA